MHHSGAASKLAGICSRRVNLVAHRTPAVHSRPSFSDHLLLDNLFRKMDVSSSIRLPAELVVHFWNTRRFESNKGLVQMLRSTGSLKSKRVRHVMKELDRGSFVPAGENPYADNPVPIGYNATISAPHMHAECLQLLDQHLQPGMHALDVGSGTGYLTAAFALLVGEEGQTVGVDHIPELVQQSIVNIRNSNAAPLLVSGRLSLQVGDGREGWPESAPYNAIHVGAAAKSIPEALVEQLKAGGRMVIPVGDTFQDLKVIDKHADGTTEEWTVTAVRYVPLTDRTAQLRGY